MLRATLEREFEGSERRGKGAAASMKKEAKEEVGRWVKRGKDEGKEEKRILDES